MCEVASFKNFENSLNSLTAVKVMTKTKVAPFIWGTVYYFTRRCSVWAQEL